ncbi:MAG TPA: helix-turn-helix domain-containing protein, partial [Planctomycetaceae bacterium]|nr:helix-turn-helix domain-containing protein [Planctomycetaceae bacterium]
GGIFNRESSPRGNLQQARDCIVSELRRLGCRKKIVIVSAAGEKKDITGDRPKFKRAVALAKEHDAILVAWSRDRFFRGRFFDGKHQREAPSWREWRCFERMVRGVDVATILRPDSTWAEVLSRATIRGHRYHGSVVGGDHKPGCKKRRRERLWPKVLKFHKQGLSTHQISRRTGINQPTVWRWIRRYG